MQRVRLSETLIEDAAWWYDGRSLRSVVLALRYRTFRPVFTLRLYQAARGRLPRLLLRIVHHAACQRAGIDLWPQTVAGPGLRILHGWGLVVNPRTRLGRDVVLMQGVTLGQRGRGGEAPVIGDRVLVGANAAVLGEVTIGDGATISAGCVVVTDVPPGTLVYTDAQQLVMRPLERPFSKDNPAP